MSQSRAGPFTSRTTDERIGTVEPSDPGAGPPTIPFTGVWVTTDPAPGCRMTTPGLHNADVTLLAMQTVGEVRRRRERIQVGSVRGAGVSLPFVQAHRRWGARRLHL